MTDNAEALRLVTPYYRRLKLSIDPFCPYHLCSIILAMATAQGPGNPAIDSQSRVLNIIAVVVATLIMATSTTVLRFYTRTVMIRQLGADDWAALVALVSNDSWKV